MFIQEDRALDEHISLIPWDCVGSNPTLLL